MNPRHVGHLPLALLTLCLALWFVGGGALPPRPSGTAESPDAVRSLPGYGDPSNWVHMSTGYVTVSQSSQRKLFYGLVRSRRDPERDPLLLWLQGGPGCSGMGLGFWSVVGPFFIRGGPLGSGERLVPNNFTWAQVANVIFLESPAFTGFSTSQDPEDRASSDPLITQDHVTFLHKFLELYPDLRSRDIYLAGESYAGHYLPLLATKLLALKASRHPEHVDLELKGIIAGNPWTSPLHDNLGAIDWWYGQGLIGRATRDGLLTNCALAKGALWRTVGPNGLTPTCNAWRDRAYAEVGHVDLYALMAPPCTAERDATELPEGAPVAGNPHYDPCNGRRIRAYMNRGDVQRALHALPDPGQARRQLQGDPASSHQPAHARKELHGSQQQGTGRTEEEEEEEDVIEWKMCSGPPDLTYPASSIGSSVSHLYPSLLRAGVRVLLLSGNQDGYVPTLATRSWLEAVKGLAPEPRSPFTTWTEGASGRVGGYVTTYRASMAGVGAAGEARGAAGGVGGVGVRGGAVAEDAEARPEGSDGRGASGALGRCLASTRLGSCEAAMPGGADGGEGTAPAEGARLGLLGTAGREQASEVRAPSGEEGSTAGEPGAAGDDSGLRSDPEGAAGRVTNSSHGELLLVVVLNAGHSVPVFQPAGALQLLTAFLDGLPLSGDPLK